MSPREKQRKVVAELGRPETPEEEAARRAENSRLYRQRKTINNLVLSLLVTVGVVLLIFFAVPRAENTPNWQVDYVAQSKNAEAALGKKLLVPAMPPSWKANAAELRANKAEGITSWYIGFITPTNQYIGYEEAFGANPTWVANTLKKLPSTGKVVIDGRTWTEYNNRSTEGAGNAAYALVTTAGDRTIVLYGTGSNAEFQALATSITADLARS